MKNKVRRSLAFLLSAAMIFTMWGSPVYAVADSGQPETENGTPAQEESKQITVTSFADLPENVREQSVTTGTALEALNLPDTLRAFGYEKTQDSGKPKELTIERVTWIAQPEFDQTIPGEYHFYPVLPVAYGLATDIAIPSIVVTVLEENLAFIPLLDAEEQFTNLTPGGTYYFDLSGENIPGEINDKHESGATSVPDTTLHYVPFTYIGTINAYVLNESSSGVSGSSKTAAAATAQTGDRQYGYTYDHSLFVSDYNVTSTVSWLALHNAGFIFGKNYISNGIPYTMRAPSVGEFKGISVGSSVIPENNEWDVILSKDKVYLKNWSGIYSWGQDTYRSDVSYRTFRGDLTQDRWNGLNHTETNKYAGFRPVLEILNDLGSSEFKSVTLDLNGGTLGSSYDDIQIIVKNDETFAAPVFDGLTRPDGESGSFFMWQDINGRLYDPGDSIPADVTALTAQWEPPVYTVTLNTNGGSIANGKDVTSYTYGTGVTLPTVHDITYAGRAFKGWYADEDFSGSDVTEINSAETGDKTFYAKWEKINYIITIQNDGEGTGTATPAIGQVGIEISLAATPQEGCHFKEWKAPEGIIITDNKFNIPDDYSSTENITITAVFEEHIWSTDWITDDLCHWHKCMFANCTVKKDIASHSPSASATCTAPQICTICNFELAPVNNNHNWGAWESISDTQHKRTCDNDSNHSETKNHSWNSALTCEECGVTQAQALTIEGVEDSYTYTGDPIQPEITVKDGRKTLDAGTDYTVSYGTNNAVAGGGSVTVTMSNPNYTGSKTVNFTITKAVPAYTAPDGLTAVYGQTLSDISLASGTGSGAWSWPDDGVSVGNAGTQSHEAVFTPNDTANYQTMTVPLDVEVAKAKLELSAGAPAASAIEYGQKLAASAFTGGAVKNTTTGQSVDGAWSWADGSLRPDGVGTYTTDAVFTAYDKNNYDTLTVTGISVSVSAATPMVVVVPDSASAIEGEPISVKATVTNPYDSACAAPEAALTYRIGDGAEQALTGGRFTIPDGTPTDTVIIITAATRTEGNYLAATGTATVIVTKRPPTAPSYSITPPAKTEGGKVSVSANFAKQGDMVTLSVEVDEGYELEELIVTDASGVRIEVSKTADGKFIFKMPGSGVKIEPVFEKEPKEQEMAILKAQVRDLADRDLNDRDTKVKYVRGKEPKTAVTYISSNNKVVRVDEEGHIRYTGLGEAAITVKAEGTKEYKEACVTVAVKVGLRQPTFTPASRENAFTITSSTVRGAEKFQVQYVEKGRSFKNKAVKSKTFTADDKLRKGRISAADKKTYRIRVRALNGEVKSQWSPVKIITTK